MSRDRAATNRSKDSSHTVYSSTFDEQFEELWARWGPHCEIVRLEFSSILHDGLDFEHVQIPLGLFGLLRSNVIL